MCRQYAHAGILREALEAGVCGGLGGAVVEHQDFIRHTGGMAVDALDAGLEEVGFVFGGDDDAGQRVCRDAEPGLVDEGVVAVVDPVELRSVAGRQVACHGLLARVVGVGLGFGAGGGGCGVHAPVVQNLWYVSKPGPLQRQT